MISMLLTMFAVGFGGYALGWSTSNFKHRVERRALRQMIETAADRGRQIADAHHEQQRRITAAGNYVDPARTPAALVTTVPPTDGTTGGSTMGGGKAP